MLKVLQVVGTMNRGGAEVMLMDILRNKPESVHFDFLVNNPPEDLYREGVFDPEIRARGCEIRHIGSQLRLGPRKYVRQFIALYEELRPDVVHVHLNAKCGIIALAAHKAGCKRIITHCHADIRFRGPLAERIWGELELFFQKFLIAWYATDWWGCSEEANRRLYWPWLRRKCVVINNAIDLKAYQSIDPQSVSAIRKSYRLPASTLVLGNVGRIVPHKNIAFILDVMLALRERGQDAAFVVVGRDDSPDYTAVMRARAREMGIREDRVLWLGERGDIPAVLQTFDIFVGPALKEGFGLVAVEAQAAGISCLLSEGFPKTVDMEVGLCRRLQHYDAGQWADEIVVLAANRPETTSDMIAKQIRRKGFDVAENARRVCEMYRKQRYR